MENGKDYWCNYCEEVTVKASEEENPNWCPKCNCFGLRPYPIRRTAIEHLRKNSQTYFGTLKNPRVLSILEGEEKE